MAQNAQVCKNCAYWRDYEPRVYIALRNPEKAKLGAGLVPDGHGLAEARPCRFQPAPGIARTHSEPFTGEAFSCENFKPDGR